MTEQQAADKADRLTRQELGAEFNEEGRWEEFHQRKGNEHMYEFHKRRRLALEQEYRRRYS